MHSPAKDGPLPGASDVGLRCELTVPVTAGAVSVAVYANASAGLDSKGECCESSVDLFS